MHSPALGYEDALSAVLSLGAPLPGERTALEDLPGRALAEPIASPIALPPWDNAGMDGFAVRRDDVRGASADAPRRLRVVATIAAGADASTLRAVPAGCAARIMTGAPMPPGVDAVVRIEDTDRGLEQVEIRSDRDAAGRGNVRPRGEELEVGQEVFAAGTTIGAAHLGVLASVGVTAAQVHRRPRVTIVSGGDELVLAEQFDEVRAGRRIVSSTSYALPALLRAAGAEVRTAPLVRDTLEANVAALSDALDQGCDLLVTTGGVSVGEHDYTRDALHALGGTPGFWRARIRPGGPIGTGRVRNVPWVGLPGNPVSSMVTGTLFVAPLIRLLGGHRRTHGLWVPARMLDAAETPAPLVHFLRVSVTASGDGMPEARLAGAQGSNLLRTMALANALLRVPEERARVALGDVLPVLLLPDVLWQERP